MGNLIFNRKLSAVVPRDIRVDKWVKMLELEPGQVETLFMQYQDLDKEKMGFLNNNDFIQHLSFEVNLLTAGIFELVVTSRMGVCSFGEFLDIVCTFGMFEVSEILKFIFFVLDPEKMGDADIKETAALIYSIHGVQNSNLEKAVEYLKSLDDGGDGRISFKDLLLLHNSYPFVFAPAFKLQTNLNREFLGVDYWEAKKLEFVQKREEAQRIERMKKEAAARDIEKEEQRQFEEMVMKKMGWKYYGMFWRRENARAKLKKMAALNKQLEALEKKEADAALALAGGAPAASSAKKKKK